MHQDHLPFFEDDFHEYTDEELIRLLGFDDDSTNIPEDTHLPDDIAAEFQKIHEETIKENENPIPD